MKILLLTDIPPCKNFTAGLVLDRLVDFIPKDDLTICSIENVALTPELSEKLTTTPILRLRKPREMSFRIGPKLFGSISGFFFELVQAFRVNYIIFPKIVRFARKEKVEKIWVILQGQTMIRLAYRLSKKQKEPLLTQVWDPFSWWLRDNKIDKLSQFFLMQKFEKVIVSSSSCPTVSWKTRIGQVLLPPH